MPNKGHLEGVTQPQVLWTYDHHGYSPLTSHGMKKLFQSCRSDEARGALRIKGRV